MPQTIENPLIQKEQTKQKCIFRFTLLRLVCTIYVLGWTRNIGPNSTFTRSFLVPHTNSSFFGPLTIGTRNDMKIANKQICIIIQN